MKNRAKIIIAIVGLILAGGIAAVIYYFSLQEPSPQVEAPKASEAEVADWQVHTDSLYGFTFKYPQNWTATMNEKSPETLDLYPADNRPKIGEEMTGDIVIRILSNPDKLSLRNYYKVQDPDNRYRAILIGSVAIVSGIGAERFQDEGYTTVSLPKEELIIEITDKGNRHQKDNIFQKIVDTVAFLE